MDFVKLFQQLDPQFSLIQESELKVFDRIVGFETTILNTSNRAISGGVGIDQQTSRQKAVAEFIERKLFLRLLKEMNHDLKMSTYPTTCGFAVGFERENTKQRSMNEALERWAWSQWIDFGYQLNETEMHLTSHGEFFHSHFNQIRSFKHEFQINDQKLYFTVTLGLQNGGIFAGSKVGSNLIDCWEHSLSESTRHYLIHAHQKPANDLFQKRIRFFGDHAEVALNQIRKAKKINWPDFEIDFCREIHTDIENVFAFRTIMKNYLAWHLGNERRFVY